MDNIAKYFSDLLSDAFGAPEDQKRTHHERISKFLTQDLEYYFSEDQLRRSSTVSGRQSSTTAVASSTLDTAPERIESKLVKLLKAILCVLEKKQELRATVLAPAYELLLKAERVLEGLSPADSIVQTSSRSVLVQDITATPASSHEEELKRLKEELAKKDHLLQELRKNHEVLQQKALAALEDVKLKAQEREREQQQQHHQQEEKEKEQRITKEEEEKDKEQASAKAHSDDIDKQVRQLKDALRANLKQLSEAENRHAEKDKQIAELQAIIESKEQQQHQMEDELRETKRWYNKREKPLLDERDIAVDRLEIMKKEIIGMQKFIEYHEKRNRNTEELYSLMLRDDNEVHLDKAAAVH